MAIDLKLLQKKIDNFWKTETKESLTKWIKSKRK